VGRLPRTANPADLDQVQAQLPDSLKRAVQGGLVQGSADHRDLRIAGHIQTGECRGRFLIWLSGQADLVAREHESFLPRSSLVYSLPCFTPVQITRIEWYPGSTEI
jgi:hypothetical protein